MAKQFERNYHRNLALSSLIAIVVLFCVGIVVVFLAAQGSVGEIRSKAAGYKQSSRFVCGANDPNSCGGHPDYCQCMGGPSCTSTMCVGPLRKSCEMQGRAWCVNGTGVGYTCCAKGYGCSPTTNGCFKK